MKKHAPFIALMAVAIAGMYYGWFHGPTYNIIKAQQEQQQRPPVFGEGILPQVENLGGLNND